jgi:hypothetical protein
MTVRQFNKLPADKQQEVHNAYLALMSPSNVMPLADPAAADTRVIPCGHLSIDQKMAIGRWLLHQMVTVPRGHFGPWLEKQEGLSRHMAFAVHADGHRKRAPGRRVLRLCLGGF